MQHIRKKLDSLPHQSKQWWALNKQLLRRNCSSRLFPPLRDEERRWCKDPLSKANAFARCWGKKFTLSPAIYDFIPELPSARLTGLNVIRTRAVKRELRRLRPDQATGPDGIPAIVLRTLAPQLAHPVAILCRRAFRDGCWPQPWRLHFLAPLLKKGSAFEPGQYRGIHLTTILSKTVERVIGSPLINFLAIQCYGQSQWAFRARTGARDLVTITVAKWVLEVCRGRKVGILLSDISGAFDRVSREILLCKLAASGVPRVWIDFLNSYLQPREGRVLVEGAMGRSSDRAFGTHSSQMLSELLLRAGKISDCLLMT